MLTYTIHDAQDVMLVDGTVDGAVYVRGAPALVPDASGMPGHSVSTDVYAALADAVALVNVTGQASTGCTVHAYGDVAYGVFNDGVWQCQLILDGASIGSDATTVHFPRGMYTAVAGTLAKC